VEDLVHRMNAFDWTAGMIIWQSRAQPQPAHECDAKTIGGLCFAEAMWPYKIDESEFGYNWTHPYHPLTHPFLWRDHSWLGSDPDGQMSAAKASFRLLPAGGFSAVVLPFFAEQHLPQQRGNYEELEHGAHPPALRPERPEHRPHDGRGARRGGRVLERP